MLHLYYCLVLLHLFALEHFSAGTVNEYERDCICVDSTGLFYKVLKSALVAENAAVSLQIQMVSQLISQIKPEQATLDYISASLRINFRDL